MISAGMRPLAIFRQGGNNRRIGNTFMWVERAKAWCDKNGFDFVFPKNAEIFDGIFNNIDTVFPLPHTLRDAEAIWNSHNADQFGTVVSQIARTDIREIGSPQHISLIRGILGWIRMGQNDWDSSDNLVSFIKSHSVNIIEEPFPFRATDTKVSTNLSVSDEISLSIRKTTRSNVGVTIHVRQGDYKRWRNGIFYRSSDFYNTLVEKALDFSSEHGLGNVAVVDNGEFEINPKFKSMIFKPHHLSSFSPEVQDLIILAGSKIIVGPISTFAKFAISLCCRAGLPQPTYYPFELDDQVCDIIERIALYDKK